MEISLYLIVALALGFFFGWFIAKLLVKEKANIEVSTLYASVKHESSVEKKESSQAIQQELYDYKKENKVLQTENKKLKLAYDGQKYVLDEHNGTLDEFQGLIKSKDDVIEQLSNKLLTLEGQTLALKKKHDSEIDAFLFERIDITEKYKNLLEKHEARYPNSIKEERWLTKIFSVPSKS
jgi:hypothetical protein